jgi:hypothetical protein
MTDREKVQGLLADGLVSEERAAEVESVIARAEERLRNLDILIDSLRKPDNLTS